MPFSILQLSDPHFGPFAHWRGASPEENARVLLEEVLATLRANHVAPIFNAVLLSGDFTWSAKIAGNPDAFEEGFQTAESFVFQLLASGVVDKKGLLVLPGNHDIQWGGVGPDGRRLFQPRSMAEKRYRDFLAKIFQPGIDPPRDRNDLGACQVFTEETPPVVVVTLNSSRIESAETAGVGYVGYHQLHSLLAEVPFRIGDRSQAEPVYVAALHHHLHPPESTTLDFFKQPLEKRKHSFVTDGTDVLSALLDAGFSLVLHGHYHRAAHYIYGSPAVCPPLGNWQLPQWIGISGAGSVGLGSDSGNMRAKHQFQVIQIRDSREIQIASFTADLTAPLRTRNWSLGRVEMHLPDVRPNGWTPAARLDNPKKVEASVLELGLFENRSELIGLRSGDTGATEVVKAKAKRRWVDGGLDGEAFDRLFPPLLDSLKDSVQGPKLQDEWERQADEPNGRLLLEEWLMLRLVELDKGHS